jgi:hypothetical protein
VRALAMATVNYLAAAKRIETNPRFVMPAKAGIQ